MQLRNAQTVLYGEETGRVPEDALALGGGAGQHTGIVGQEDAWQTEGAGDIEEVGGLVGGVAVDGAGHHARIVGHDGHAAASEMGEHGHDRGPESGLHVEHCAAVDQFGEHGPHGIWPAGVGRDQPEEVDRPGPASGPSRRGGGSQALSGKWPR